MRRGAGLAALLAILGMAGISLGAAVVLSRACCSADCEKCPLSFCKDSNADLALKIVVPEIATADIPFAMAFETRILAPVGHRTLEAPRSGFVRPMRN